MTARRRGQSVADLRRLCLALPEVDEGTSYGTPAWRVKRKWFARLRECGDLVVIRTDFDERETLLASDPKFFQLTDHYVGYPLVLVSLRAATRAKLAEVLEMSYRRTAPAKLVARLDV